ncbi:type II toxin-antitoxin system toxin DNA ADP-ribosyl transferase DarT [Nitrosomonas communis]|uniref:DarT domain-containing protein n=1 Tax=Nitrosomonas communis TaxID=44574 RepID=A0A1H2UY33_9PROT|nr:DUF4433 domain-containing protein [Nitrosomonas communis]SDW60534.1 protein of unknown function [Nitrosomonas communis]
MPAPQPVRLFHITAITNLSAICTSGALVSKNLGASAGINYQNIAHQGAQSVRGYRNVPDPPGGTVHDFVPFYFAPRSPMLYAINGGRVTGCELRQKDIVYLETSVDRVTAHGAAFVFYDRNATLAFSTPYTDLAKLHDAIAWHLLMESPTLDGFCKYWQNNPSSLRYADRMERRQAEFLVKDRVSLDVFLRIGVIDQAAADKVNSILAVSGVNLRVDIMQNWYFLGQ